jgi:hypothetical protein
LAKVTLRVPSVPTVNADLKFLLASYHSQRSPSSPLGGTGEPERQALSGMPYLGVGGDDLAHFVGCARRSDSNAGGLTGRVTGKMEA